MKCYNVENAYNTAKRLNLTKDDLLQEANLVEDEGSWYHMSFLGYSAEELRKVAELLEAAYVESQVRPIHGREQGPQA